MNLTIRYPGLYTVCLFSPHLLEFIFTIFYKSIIPPTNEKPKLLLNIDKYGSRELKLLSQGYADVQRHAKVQACPNVKLISKIVVLIRSPDGSGWEFPHCSTPSSTLSDSPIFKIYANVGKTDFPLLLMRLNIFSYVCGATVLPPLCYCCFLCPPHPHLYVFWVLVLCHLNVVQKLFLVCNSFRFPS